MSRRRFMIGKRKDIDLSKDLIDYYKFYYSTKDEITGITNSASISYSANAIIDMSGHFGSYSPLKFARSSVVYPEFTISVWIKLDGSYYNQYRGIFHPDPQTNMLSMDLLLRILYLLFMKIAQECIPRIYLLENGQ